uniref:Glycosyltransferase n=1 Tax=viral metagenome TaxID=1070528 RepID=A0A6M3JRT5_9ZZZZ
MNESVKSKKPVIIFSIADEKNKPFANNLLNSLRKFHPDIPFHLVEGEELEAYLKLDPSFFYRATPTVAEKFINDYDLVLKIDADSIIVGNLNYVFQTKDYDIGTVVNWNRKDAEEYPLVGGWGILPIEYFNCGFVAMRSEKFVKHWKDVCQTPQFDRMQYKEQDLLNALCYFGNYNVRCFDHLDPLAGNNSWWGLLGKGEYKDAILRNKEITIPKGKGDKPFPPKEVSIKVIHFAGGQNNPQKGNYRVMFNQEIIEYLDSLIK